MSVRRKQKSNKRLGHKVSGTARGRTARSRAVSFFIGVVTVIAIAFIFFQYAQSNNYKTVLGSQTHQNDPR